MLGCYTHDRKRASGASDGSAGKLTWADRSGTGMTVDRLDAADATIFDRRSPP
jgi:hypothetical protein